jgi:hypothetical protein
MTDPNASQKHLADSGAADSNAAEVEQWTRRLTQALQILDLRVDQALVAELAARSSETFGSTSVPVTTFVVGYAAGLSAAAGSVNANEATKRAADVALRLCAEAPPAAPQPDGSTKPPDADGWLSTAQ